MPHESATCEVGLGTSFKKCFTTPICLSRSINFQTGEYCQQLHLEVCERNTSSHSEVQQSKSPWGQKLTIFSVAKDGYTCFISSMYDKLCQIS